MRGRTLLQCGRRRGRGWGGGTLPPHHHANTRLISEITEYLLYAGLRSKHGPSCACCRVMVTGGHLLFPFHRAASRGSEIPFVPSEGLKVGLAAQGARRVTSHDSTPTSLPCPLCLPSCFHGGLASAQPPVIQAGSVPRLSCWPEAWKPHPRRPQARSPWDKVADPFPGQQRSRRRTWAPLPRGSLPPRTAQRPHTGVTAAEAV